MAFIQGTKVLTNSGWKNIEDIAGQDKVLVRNFIGDAEFIQPFALKKKKYDGEIIKISGKGWAFAVTPDHIVVYDRRTTAFGDHFVYEKAKDLKIDERNRIQRKFKYLPIDDYKREAVVFYTPFGKRWVTISNEDWYVLVAFTLCRGYIDTSSKKPALNFRLDREKNEEELLLLSDILDRIGVEWSLIPSYTTDTLSVRLTSTSPIARRIITRLGSKKRKEMFLPDKMIYNSSKELAVLLIETIIKLSKKLSTERGSSYQFTTNNEKLVESLQLLGTLAGYGMNKKVMVKKGDDSGRGAVKKDVLNLVIANLAATYSPLHIEQEKYLGYVYEIDLFDGQVYVKEGTAPVWVNPR